MFRTSRFINSIQNIWFVSFIFNMNLRNPRKHVSSLCHATELLAPGHVLK